MLCFNIHGENSICWIVYISTIPWCIQFNYSLSCIVSMNSSGAALYLNFKSHVQCYMNLLATHRMYSVTGIYWQHIVYCTVLQEFTWNQYLLATHRMYSVTEIYMKSVFTGNTSYVQCYRNSLEISIYWQHIVCTVLHEFTWNQYLLATHRMYSVTGIYWQHIVCTVLQEFTGNTSYVQCYRNSHEISIYWQHIVCTVLQEFIRNQYLLATHRMYSVTGIHIKSVFTGNTSYVQCHRNSHEISIYWQHIVCQPDSIIIDPILRKKRVAQMYNAISLRRMMIARFCFL